MPLSSQVSTDAEAVTLLLVPGGCTESLRNGLQGIQCGLRETSASNDRSDVSPRQSDRLSDALSHNRMTLHKACLQVHMQTRSPSLANLQLPTPHLLLIRQLPVEHADIVLLNPLWVLCLDHGRHAALDAPLQQHLQRSREKGCATSLHNAH